MRRMTTIVLVEDHNLVRAGLKHLIQDDKTLKLVGEASDGIEAVVLVERLRPRILLLDLMIPRLHGLEVIRQVKKLRGTSTIVISMHADEPYVIEAFRNGACGYVLKDSTPAELITAIKTVISGGRYLSPTVSDLTLSAYVRNIEGESVEDVYRMLSPRERIVLQLAAEGRPAGDIARELYISPRTVESHRASLMKKLSLRTQTDLVKFAIRRKIIEV